MAENYDLIFGQSASEQYAWSDSDYQNGWQTVGSTPPTAEQFDALQRRSDTKAKDLNDRLTPLETNNTNNYRQPSTAYSVGDIAFHQSLPTGYYLECTVAGTTSSGALSTGGGISVYDTITDGTVTWIVLNVHVGTFNKKETFTSSGTFVAPVSGTYKITLQGGGGGGGGAGASGSGYRGGGGGGQGGHGVFYEKLTAGTTYTFTIGAGGAGGTGGSSSTSGTDGTTGGDSTITINATVYTAKGGATGEGAKSNAYCKGGRGGAFKVGDTVISYAASGGYGNAAVNNAGGLGGTGGGPGGAISQPNNVPDAANNGGGGGGGNARTTSTGYNGGVGGDGYITFEYCDVA